MLSLYLLLLLQRDRDAVCRREERIGYHQQFLTAKPVALPKSATGFAFGTNRFCFGRTSLA